ncbi:MAG: phosphate acetyltransferase [Paracoccaceae bacterium]
METINNIYEIARASKRRICLSEGEDPRVVEAAIRATRYGLAEVQLIGDAVKIEAQLDRAGGGDGIKVIDPLRSSKTTAYAESYLELRRHKGMTAEVSLETMQTNLGFAAMMVRNGDSDGTIGGAVATTSDTVRAALQIIGKAPDFAVVSSCFLMMLKEPFNRAVAFADCGLIMQPTSEELANIAIATADTFSALTGQTPRIAMLSFSTMGSVKQEAHESIERIRVAVDLVRAHQADLMIDGEIQFDAAIVPEVANKKAPSSQLAGDANIFVFPSLSAGNIGYKIAQRIGGAVALGPILQGLSRPANDLSRGCSAEDVYQMIAVTAAQCLCQS